MSWSDRPASAARDDGTTSADVVFDRTNLTPERRAAVAALFPEHRRVVVVCSAWLATLFERVATRAARSTTYRRSERTL